MNKDIRLSVSFFHHPKTIKMQSLLGSEGILSLLRLWCYAGEWKQSGDLSTMSDEEIECAALFVGPHGKFIESLYSVRFLDENRCLHDWSEHNPYAFYAPIRSIKARISAHLKHGDEKSANALRKQHGIHAKRMRNAVRKTGIRTAPSPDPIPDPIPDPAPYPDPDPIPTPRSKALSDGPDFESIISDLNTKTGKAFKATSATTRKHIQARWNDGYRLDDFRKVHSTMCAKWLTDPKMAQYLRPETLYSPKFEGYLNTVVSLSDQGLVSSLTEKNIAIGDKWLTKKEFEKNA